jgi:hypothetical protein
VVGRKLLRGRVTLVDFSFFFGEIENFYFIFEWCQSCWIPIQNPIESHNHVIFFLSFSISHSLIFIPSDFLLPQNSFRGALSSFTL